MKFRQILNEKFSVGLKMKMYGQDEIYVEIFENPSTKEIADTLRIKNNGYLRGVVVPKGKPTLYIWDGDIIHSWISTASGYKWNKISNSKRDKIVTGVRFAYSKQDGLTSDSSEPHNHTEKQKKQIYDTLKQYFPKSKTFKVFDRWGNGTVTIDLDTWETKKEK